MSAGPPSKRDWGNRCGAALWSWDVAATENRTEPVLRGATEHEENAVGIVRSVLTPELLPPEWQNHPHPIGGYCYVASKALYYLLGGSEAWLTVKRAPGVTHARRRLTRWRRASDRRHRVDGRHS
jgi:hypothetical protein